MTVAAAVYGPPAAGGTPDNDSVTSAKVLDGEIGMADLATMTDVTTHNASTSAHGFAPKATAPAAGLVSALAIGNGETAYTNKALYDTTNPAALGAVGPGTATVAARRDHIHPNPALDSLAAASDTTTLDATTTSHGLVVKATAPAANVLNVVGIANGETAYTNKALFDATAPEALGVAAAGTSLFAAHRDHVHEAPAAVVDINGTTSTTTVVGGDKALIYDVSATANRSAELWRLLSMRGMKRYAFTGIPISTGGTLSPYNGDWELPPAAKMEQWGTPALGPAIRILSNSVANWDVQLGVAQGGTQYAVVFTGGEWIFNARFTTTSALSDGTDTYDYRFGFHRGGGSTGGSYGANFYYSHGTNSGKWQAVTENSDTETTADTGITFAANTTYTLSIHVNAAGNSVAYYIDGALVATIATNVPGSGADKMTCAMTQRRTAGTATRYFYLGLCECIFIPTTAW